MLGQPVSTYAPALVDSGTTFVYASTPLFRAIHAHVKLHTPSLAREGYAIAHRTGEPLACRKWPAHMVSLMLPSPTEPESP